MTYKILIVKNRFKKKLNFEKGLAYFKEKTPLEISTEEITTDFEITPKQVGNATYKGVVCGDDLYEKLRSVIPPNKYHCVVFIYGNDLNGIRVSITPQMPLYAHTDLIQLVKTTDRGMTLNHEIFHALTHKAQRQGANFNDVMDSVVINGKTLPYYNDNMLDAPESNRTIALGLLTPWWDKIGLLENSATPFVSITRLSDSGKETLGKLVAKNGNATFTCDTLERPWLNNQPNISCIPKGTYEVKWEFSMKFMRNTYRLQNVKDRSAILIHSGNYAFKFIGQPDISGCILLGDGFKDINADSVVDIINSKQTISAFENFLNKQSFILTIN